MPQTIQYSNNPNSDTAFVVQDGGQKKRAVLTAEPSGTLQLSDSANVSTGYVTGEDGKKHKVNLVAQLEGDIEFSENPNSTKGYATIDGKKHRVVLTASLAGGGGSTPVIDKLNVTPSTSAQVITAPSGTDGFSPVNVAAVTSAIDANITAGNIKKDVSILGVTGSYEGVAPSGTKQITTNGVHDVAGFANADVQVPTTAPAYYVEKTVDANGKLMNSTNIINLNGATDVGNYVLMNNYRDLSFPANTIVDLSSLTTISGIHACNSMFKNSAGITSVDLSSLTIVSGDSACQNMFENCTNITSIDLSSLTTVTAVSGNSACQGMFKGCGRLTSVDLSNLTTINTASACNSMFQSCQQITSVDLSELTTLSGAGAGNAMFQGCVSLTSIDLSSLTTLSGYTSCTSMFSQCTGLTTAKLNALNAISEQIAPSYGAVFYGCTKLESVEFGGLTASTFASAVNQLQYLFNAQTGSQATNGCTVHFPSNFDPSDPNHTFDASTLTGYPTFGGSASYIHVAFDLPATES